VPSDLTMLSIGIYQKIVVGRGEVLFVIFAGSYIHLTFG